jgi:hypothetical protein
MKKLATVVSLAAALVVSTAHAGTTFDDRVTVVARGASGSFVDAAYAASPSEYINCSLNAGRGSPNSTSSYMWIACAAKDGAGKVYSCSLNNPSQALVDIVAGLNETSWIYFWGDANNTCLGLLTHRGSLYLL